MNAKHALCGVLGLGAIFFLAVHFSGVEDKANSTSLSENSATTSSNTMADSNSAEIITIPQAAPTTAPNEKKKDFRYLQERLTAMQERRPAINFDPEQVAAAIERDVAWAPLTEIPKELPLEPEEFTDGREFISFDSLKMETLMPGDRIRIPIQALGREYEVTIDKVEKHDYNSISWNGHIEGGDGQNYNASFTRGANLTVGGMDTPDGQYQLQATGDKGWIASSGLLFKHHSDPIDPNTVEPGSVPSTNTHTQ
ncbi:MAG: hypothetical protein Q7T48_05770 [Cellvibrio sp.]|uniref:hypothetical protein n=1 Tax=Cellvibrio sp. TaxID=1965322 RepID=UPI00271808CB|nr:hypothetical protein [Cellvibrio sp.]